MKSFRSYLTKLDRSNHSPTDLGRCAPTPHHKLVRTLFATTLVASSQLLAVLSASASPAPTPALPSPIVPTRTILNGSFEQPVVTNRVGNVPTLDRNIIGSAVDNTIVGIPEQYGVNPPIIWSTTEPGDPNRSSTDEYKFVNEIEIWRGVNEGNGGQGPHATVSNSTSGVGRQHAEINAGTNASLYQDVCIIPGETVNWSLLHSARNSGETNKMQVSITDPTIWANSKTPPATQLYNSGDLTTSFSDGWQKKTGSWTSPNGSSKTLRFAFQAIKGSSNDASQGNFIDDVKLDLSPLIDFLPTNGGNVNLGTTTEGNTTSGNPSYYYLSLRINGITTSASTVKINLTGLNAARQFSLGAVLKGNTVATTAGFTATKIGNEITLTIPAGTYDANAVSNYIHIPIDFGDTVKKPNDNLLFTLTSAVGGGTGGVANLAVGATNCANTPRIQVETVLIDDDYVEKVQLPLPLTVAAQRSN